MATQRQPQPPRGSMEDGDIVVELSRFWFVVAWWGLLLAHASCAGFLVATSMLYSYLGDAKLIYYNKLLGSSLAGQLSQLGWLFSVVGSVHVLEMLKMIAFSVHARELSLWFQSRKQKITPALPSSVVAVRTAQGPASGDPTAQPASGDTTAQPAAQKDPKVPAQGETHATTNTRTHRAAACLLAPPMFLVHKLASLVPQRVKMASKRLVRAVIRLRRALYDKRHGYMSVQSRYFHYLFLIRETIEIASQSYQMYNSSTLLARPWINAFFLALVVMNCWSTPILQHALAHSSGLERVICLVLDGLLDAGSAIYIPLIVFIPYAQVFDTESLSFPSDYLYDPQWFVNMVRENRMLFAMSGKDLFSKLVPHHSLYSCMKNVKKFIVRKHDPGAQQHYEPGTENGASVASKQGLSFTTSFRFKRENVEYPSRGKQLVHFVFTSWGIAVLAIYLHARHVSISNDVSACKLELRPWFVTSFACASYNFDCYEQGQVDTLTSSDLSILYQDSLAALIISNCPAVEMPSELQNFPNLLKFLLYNSTITSWDANASLNVNNHTTLVSICLVRVNMTEFPLGLQQQLPDAMLDFQVSTSNLTSLPSALARSWHPMTILYFEHCEFTEFPLVLLEIRADDMSLAGAKITSLPSNMSSAQFAWVDLVLAGNTLLTELPANAMKAGLLSLSIENTAVREIPSWVYSDMATGTGSLEVYAYNTPYCIAQSLAAAASSFSSSSSSSSSVTVATAATNAVASNSAAATASSSSSSSSGSSSSTPPAASSGSSTGGDTMGGSVTVNCETRDPSGEERYPLALTTATFQPAALEDDDTVE